MSNSGPAPVANRNSGLGWKIDPEHPAHPYFVTRYAAARGGLEKSLGR